MYAVQLLKHISIMETIDQFILKAFFSLFWILIIAHLILQSMEQMID